jgi:CheY-like chemotaxis protein
MAHDFNNLLSVIIGSLDLAAPLLQGDVGELVHDALEAALRGAELTQRLLAFARRQPLSPRPVDINHMVTGIARLLRRTLGENIQVSLELAGGLWLVVVDPAQLEASLVSLATNARDAMPGGGRLTITTANRTLDADYALLHMDVTPGDYVMVEVDDTGTGMTRDVLDHAFEPFFTTKQPGKGTGLGLSMVFGVIKQSGGNINVYSEPGTGTTFRLYLPRTRGAADAAVAETPAPQPAHHETVLVVEDNAALRRVVTRQLTRLGYAVLEAPDAEAALVLLAERPVDLLFTDIVMPGEMDGIALARQALARWPQVKAVLTSGFPGSTFGSHLGTLAATTQILTKPYRIEDLAAALRTALKG